MASDLTYVAYDTAPSVFGALTNRDGTPFDLTDAESVRFQMRLAIDRRFTVDAAAVIVDADAGTVRYDWAEGDLATVGDFVSHWKITYEDSSIEHTVPGNTITVEPQ